MGTREDAIESLRKKAEKKMAPEVGNGNPDSDGMKAAPMAPDVKKNMTAKKKSTRAEISNPIYDKMNAERAKDRSDMRKADALKDKMHNKKKNLLKDAMKNK